MSQENSPSVKVASDSTGPTDLLVHALADLPYLSPDEANVVINGITLTYTTAEISEAMQNIVPPATPTE